jgi:hypothetical protein
LDGRAGDPSLPNLLVILWEYFLESETSSGMPTASQQSEMEAFENLLVAALEQFPDVILVAVRTFNGSRLWYWYCGSREKMEQRLNSALSGDPSYPISLRMTPDPRWDYYSSIAEAS